MGLAGRDATLLDSAAGLQTEGRARPGSVRESDAQPVAGPRGSVRHEHQALPSNRP